MDTQKVLWQLAQQVAELTAKVDILWKVSIALIIAISTNLIVKVMEIVKNHKNNGK